MLTLHGDRIASIANSATLKFQRKTLLGLSQKEEEGQSIVSSSSFIRTHLLITQILSSSYHVESNGDYTMIIRTARHT